MARDYSIAIDISLSMGEPFSDMIPSRLQASKEAVALLAQRVTVGGSRIAITLFHEKPIPLLPLTNDYKVILRALVELDFTGEGSALGDGIVEAVKMLRASRGRDRLVAILTDGGVTEGIPVKAAVLYAKYTSTPLKIIVLNRRIEENLKTEVEAAGHPNLQMVLVETKQKLLSEMLRLI